MTGLEFNSLACERDGQGACVHAMIRAPMGLGVVRAEVSIETPDVETLTMDRCALQAWTQRAIIAALCGAALLPIG
jgi:hypothetical protein